MLFCGGWGYFMKFKIKKDYVQIGLVIFMTAVAVMLVFFLLFRFKAVKNGIDILLKAFAPIIYGLIIAYILTPLLNFIERRLLIPLFRKWKWIDAPKSKVSQKDIRIISVLITMTLFMLFMYLFFASVVPEVYKSIQSIVNKYNDYKDNFISWIKKVTVSYPAVYDFVSQFLDNSSKNTADWINDFALPTLSKYLPNAKDLLFSLSGSVISFINFLWNLVIGLIMSVYVLNSKDKFVRNLNKLIYALFETPNANKVLNSFKYVHKTFIGFLAGKVIDSIIIGFLCFIIMQILHMPYPILISFVIGVTNIIPFFGPWFGAIPSGILIIMVNPSQLLIFAIFILALQQFDGNILGPKILSGSTGVSSFGIIFSITVFGKLWGVVGMIVGVPVTAVCVAAYKAIIDSVLKKKNLPSNSEIYFDVESISEDGVIIHSDSSEVTSGKKMSKIGFFKKHKTKRTNDKKK